MKTYFYIFFLSFFLLRIFWKHSSAFYAKHKQLLITSKAQSHKKIRYFQTEVSKIYFRVWSILMIKLFFLQNHQLYLFRLSLNPRIDTCKTLFSQIFSNSGSGIKKSMVGVSQKLQINLFFSSIFKPNFLKNRRLIFFSQHPNQHLLFGKKLLDSPK